MNKFSHSCIKCHATYESDEVDPYYCPKCVEEKKIIAKAVDSKSSSRPRKEIKSNLQLYDQICKARGTRFVNINDMDIKL